MFIFTGETYLTLQDYPAHFPIEASTSYDVAFAISE